MWWTQSYVPQSLLVEFMLVEMSFDDLESMGPIAFAALRKVARVVNASDKFFFC